MIIQRRSLTYPRSPFLLALLLIASTTLSLIGSGLLRHSTSPSSPEELALEGFPLLFEPNSGQTNDAVRFTAHVPPGTLFFTPSEVVMTLNKESTGNLGGTGEALSTTGQGNTLPEESSRETASVTVLRLSFVGASSAVLINPGASSPARVNYITGSDPSQWHTDLPTYTGITYSNLYPGIDLYYEGNSTQLKGTYTLAAGVDPGLIVWEYTNANEVKVDAEGALSIRIGDTLLTEQAPIAWQVADGKRTPVSVRYSVGDDGKSVGFAVGSYDPAQPLIIDPALTYSTYLGGNWAEYGEAMAADSQGNFYVTGGTNSDTFPVVNPYQATLHGINNAFVGKFNPQGEPVYITYLGGSGFDDAYDMTIDPDGNAYISGYTSSDDFPVANALQPTRGGENDAFVTKLNASGSALLFSTYLGGTASENSVGSGFQGAGVEIDAQRNVFVTGYTHSTDFPVHQAIQPTLQNIEDVFVTKFNPDGSDLIWSTYLGGGGNDQARGIGVDAAGNVVVAGFTTSSNYPTANAFQPSLHGTADAFVSKINAAGTALIFSSYLGGHDQSYPELGEDVASDAAGNAYITGYTGSTNFPVLNAFQAQFGGTIDAYVTKIGPSGALVYSSYLGGGGSDGAKDIDVNSAGEAFVMGSTQSEGFPLADPIYPTLRGLEDAFVSQLSSAGNSLVFSTFFGGSDNREMQGGGGIAVDEAGNIYITGTTESSDLPTVDPFQPFRASVHDSFVARISRFTPSPQPTPQGTATPSPTVCPLSDYTLTATTGAPFVPGTTYVPNSTCYDCTAPIQLPFPVRFYNQTFTQARLSSSGNLQFTSNNALPFNYCLPHPDYNNTIFAFWDDITTHPFGGIYTSISGTAPNRVVNIEWRAEMLYYAGQEVNFVIRLFEDLSGRVEIIYGDLDNAGSGATVGVQYDTGSRFTQFSCDTAALSSGTKLTFELPTCNATATPTSAATTPTNTPNTPSPTATATATAPTLLYSTYFGSYEREYIEDIGRDAAGNIYVMGSTFEADTFYGDILVTKFSPDGQSKLYEVILGGSRIDYGYALAVDAEGNATVAGYATSFDYPLLNPIQAQHNGGGYDVVMTKLNHTGQVVFSTYLGGSGLEYAERLQTDAAGNIYLAGRTESTDFPTTENAYQTSNRGGMDGYVTKITPNGSAIIWSTYLGGTFTDEAYDLALDSAGSVYITGHTVSPDFPTRNAYQSTIGDASGDAFVTKMNPQGTDIVYSTFLGGGNPPGPGEDNGQGITVDAAGHAYVTGHTQSPNFPTTPNAFQRFFNGNSDAFVTKLAPGGSSLVYSTFLGGSTNSSSGEDVAYDIAIDSAGHAHVTGQTNSADFPIANAVQLERGDVYDAFVTKFNADGSGLFYSTYLGGDGSPPGFTGNDGGFGILIDGSGNAVIAGKTNSYNFPVVNPYQAQSGGSEDGFISKLSGSDPMMTPTAMPSITATGTSTALATVQPTVTLQATASPQPSGTPQPTTSPTIATVTPTPCAITFSDVPEGHTFYSNIMCLACRGIISGYADNTFRPGNEVTRGQLAKIVANAAGFSEPGKGQQYEDVPVGSTFYDFIWRLTYRGLVNGYPCGGVGEPCGNTELPYFRPNANVTRGQLSKIVANGAGLTEPVTGQQYEDVVEGSTFYEYIGRLSLLGVINGYPCGGVGEPCGAGSLPYFRPGASATRGQASKIVANTFFPDCQTPSK